MGTVTAIVAVLFIPTLIMGALTWHGDRRKTTLEQTRQQTALLRQQNMLLRQQREQESAERVMAELPARQAAEGTAERARIAGIAAMKTGWFCGACVDNGCYTGGPLRPVKNPKLCDCTVCHGS
jgi:hypothetical protein